jgi:hypothetical protein
VIALYPYQTREVRDLAWACFSPTLLGARDLADDGHNVADCDLPLTPARRLWLEQLDRDATPLLNHLADARGQRLGSYFEQLWHFFLSTDPALELVAHNLPVQGSRRTLGEFDCIYRCRDRQRYYHLELAVKFFLGHRQDTTGEAASHWHEWLGPNSHDSLDKKLDRLFRHQIRLGDTTPGRERLASLGIQAPAREVVIKGYLFQPVADLLPPPYGFNEQNPLGRWLPIDRLEAFLERMETRAFLPLPRHRWLGPARADQAAAIFDRYGLAKHLHCHIAETARAQLVAGLNHCGEESHRFFVTPAQWPLPGRRAPRRSDPPTNCPTLE